MSGILFGKRFNAETLEREKRAACLLQFMFYNGDECRKRARSGDRGARGVPLPANILCWERVNVLVAYSVAGSSRGPRGLRGLGDPAALVLLVVFAPWRPGGAGRSERS
ncbi:hypothetical protein NDU88_006262 [Pleurodeles waltl]|uniref:Uncharacterized protein n=1 Tax=Pleurodeles waltl TaxID=8319 RepID=A0AAV7SP42_PLEWA|nr:hypothetical protein NDU88_006262 [Pleurodeles waltl]